MLSAILSMATMDCLSPSIRHWASWVLPNLALLMFHSSNWKAMTHHGNCCKILWPSFFRFDCIKLHGAIYFLKGRWRRTLFSWITIKLDGQCCVSLVPALSNTFFCFIHLLFFLLLCRVHLLLWLFWPNLNIFWVCLLFFNYRFLFQWILSLKFARLLCLLLVFLNNKLLLLFFLKVLRFFF